MYYEYGAFVVRQRRGETDVIEEKYVSVPLYLP
jgi:hypothetical protein